MKKYVVMIIVAAGLLLVGGIGVLAVNNWEENEKRMTPEEFIEYFGFTEEEIENVDIEKFLEKYTITRGTLIRDEVKKEHILHSFAFFPKIEPENLEGRDFTYVAFGKPLKGVKPDYDKMKYIAFQVSDTIGYSVFIDVKARKVYISPTTWEYVYQDISKAEVVLEEADLSEVIECIKNLGIEKWKGRYEKDVAYGISWRFGIEFEDGTIASYSGYEKAPEGYGELREMMLSFYYN